MSFCQVFVVKKSGDVEHFADAKKAHSISFIIWKTLSDKYKLGFSLENKTTGGVEKLAYNVNMPLFERVSLVSTFEGVWIRRENIATLINALEDFASINLIEEARLPIQEVTSILRQAFLFSDVIGVAFNQVNTTTPFWHVYEPCDKEDASLRKFNINKDIGHFELTEELGLNA